MIPIHIEKTEWKGEIFINELYDASEIPNVSPITQVQAVCFTENNQVVLYKHIDGWFGLLGGKVELNEDFFDALKREVYEETACQLVEAKLIAYVKSWKENSPEIVTYNLRYVTLVQTLNEEIHDPAGKAIERVIISVKEASKILNWGEKGEILIKLAKKKLYKSIEEIKVLAIIYKDKGNDKAFLALRNNPKNKTYGGDFYYVVTGGVENNENLEDAVLREVYEETGIKDIIRIKQLDINWEFDYKQNNRDIHCTEFGFVVEVKGEVQQLNEENIEYKWLQKETFIETIKWDNKEELEGILNKIN